MSDYLDMNCVNCGRHRVEENFVCENCGYDNKNMKYVLVSYSSQEDNETDNLSQPLLECLEHGAGTCRNEALFEALVSSGKGFRQKNKVLAEELDYLRASNGTEEIVRLTTRAEKAEEELAKWKSLASELAGFMCADCPKFSTTCTACSAADIHNKYWELKGSENENLLPKL